MTYNQCSDRTAKIKDRNFIVESGIKIRREIANLRHAPNSLNTLGKQNKKKTNGRYCRYIEETWKHSSYCLYVSEWEKSIISHNKCTQYFVSYSSPE